jgi:hypothetical protein
LAHGIGKLVVWGPGAAIAAHSCGARLKIIDVPDGRHGFDMLDHTDESREAVSRAFDTVLAALT